MSGKHESPTLTLTWAVCGAYAVLVNEIIVDWPSHGTPIFLVVPPPPPPPAALILVLLSSKHHTLKQCWFNVGPPSATLAQHEPHIGSMSRACCARTAFCHLFRMTWCNGLLDLQTLVRLTGILKGLCLLSGYYRLSQYMGGIWRHRSYRIALWPPFTRSEAYYT